MCTLLENYADTLDKAEDAREVVGSHSRFADLLADATAREAWVHAAEADPTHVRKRLVGL